MHLDTLKPRNINPKDVKQHLLFLRALLQYGHFGMSRWCPYSLRGRRSKGKEKHALSSAQTPTSPSPLTPATQASDHINRVPLYS